MVVLLSNRLDKWVNYTPKIRKMLIIFKHISWHKKPAWHLPRHATGKERTYEKEIDLLWAGLTLMSAVGCGGALVVASRRKRKETEQ